MKFIRILLALGVLVEREGGSGWYERPESARCDNKEERQGEENPR
ncbi:hypothetical protein EPIR_2229 [Erwinia piriflorinigrans CFBP 5888]|uniref:Uncharacterized protein n=1 Tax=Erwinia piriflorinigrans CFBP 5888 TaxID=1161919 RepID=V5Z8P4_9GAMM|nr:hypothetical protein EPIR_2229 [Erwinia piriflorinigrans CFBP 5888]